MSDKTDFLQSFFVGREAELHKLHDSLTGVIQEQQPKFVLVQGEVGAGKTWLVEQFLAKVQSSNEHPRTSLVGKSRCAMESEGSGLIPFTQLLRSLLTDAAQPYVISEEAQALLKETAPAWLDILSLGAVSRIRAEGGRSGGVDVNADSVQVGGDVVGGDKLIANTAHITNIYESSRRSYTQDQVFIQFVNALGRLAERRVIIAFIDDLQWADVSSLRLLSHLASNLQNVPVLFICTCEPTLAAGLSTNADVFRGVYAELVHRGAETIDIVSGLDVSLYADQRYSPNSFGHDFLTRVQKLTDGHAQFVNELFCMWESEKVIAAVTSAGDRPMWIVAGNPHFFEVPKSLKPLLDLRIGSLTKKLQEVLTLAAVEGTDFAAEVVAKLCDADELETYDQIEILERDYRLIQTQIDPDLSSLSLSFYRFAHRFVRELVYSRLNPPKQRILHKKVGECLKILYSDHRPIAGQLAEHFFKANEMSSALSYLLMAARFEQSRYAWLEAEEHCRKGLTWLELNPGISNSAAGNQLKFDLLECSANGFFNSSQYALAGDRYNAALSIIENLQVEAERLANLYCRLSSVYYYGGYTQQSVQACEAGNQVLLKAAVPFTAIHVELGALEAFMQSQLGHPAQAAATIRKLLAQAEQLPRSDALVEACGEAYNNLGVILQQLGQHSESRGAFARAIEIAEKIGSQQLAEMALLNTADNLIEIGLPNQAVDYIERGSRLAQRIGDLDGIENAQASRCEAFLVAGNPHEAIQQLSEVMSRAQAIGAAWNMPYLCAVMTKANLLVNDIDLARHYAEVGMTSAQDAGQFEQGLALDAMGQVQRAAKNWSQADQSFNEAMTIHRQAAHQAKLALVQRHYAESLLQQGKTSEAKQLLLTALATFNTLAIPFEAAQTQQLLDPL